MDDSQSQKRLEFDIDKYSIDDLRKMLKLSSNSNMIDIDRLRSQDKNECVGCDTDPINNLTLCKTDIVGQMCEPFDINGLGRASIGIRSKKVPTVSQLNKSIDEFTYPECNYWKNNLI